MSIVLLVAACGSKSGDGRAVCEKAGKKYEACMAEILGPDAVAALGGGKDGVAACARDAPTVAMYKACLPVDECGAFLDCLEAYVARSATPIAADKPRAEQCAQHVADGLRAMAFQHASSDATKDCLLDESRRWETCIGAAERAVVDQYAVQRQRECEAWPPELAACVLDLPGATGCDPDSEPLWRLPLAEGPAGPAVAWSLELRDDDDYEDDVDFTWAAKGTLVVRDDDGLRVVRDGAVTWQDAAADTEVGLTLAGGWIVVDAGDDRGLALFDIATGKRATALDGTYVERIGAAGDRVLVRAGDGEVFEVTPGKCARGAACARTLGTLDDSALSWADAIGAWQGGVVMVSTDGVHVTDRSLATRATISFSADEVVLTPDSVIVADPQGVAVLPLAACARPGTALELDSTLDPAAGCIRTRREGGWKDLIAALPGGAVAFNDEGITESTHHVGSDSRHWETRTAAVGGVAGDEVHVYAVSLGFDAAGPVRLLALARATGEVAWQTELAAKPPDSPRTRVAVRDGLVAARVGSTLYVVAALPD